MGACRALVVDDKTARDVQVVAKLKELLGDQAWEASWANTPEEAAHLLKAGPAPALVIFDLFYGPMHGPLFNLVLVLFSYLPRIYRMIQSADREQKPTFWCFSNFLWYPAFQPVQQGSMEGLFKLTLNISRMLRPEIHPTTRQYISAKDEISNILIKIGADRVFSKAQPEELWSAITEMRRP